MAAPPPPPSINLVNIENHKKYIPEKRISPYARWALQYPFHAAVQNGNNELCEAMLLKTASLFPYVFTDEITFDIPEFDIDINLKDSEGWSPICYAAFEGHSEVVKLLIQHGCDVNNTQDSKSNALQVAVAVGHLNVVEVLLSLDDQIIQTLLDHKNDNKHSVFDLVKIMCENEDIKLLIKKYE